MWSDVWSLLLLASFLIKSVLCRTLEARKCCHLDESFHYEHTDGSSCTYWREVSYSLFDCGQFFDWKQLSRDQQLR
jgi:hypothetical protein